MPGKNSRRIFLQKRHPATVEKNGIAGVRIPAGDRIFSPGGIIKMKEAMQYVLTLSVSTIIAGIDEIPELEENMSIAQNFKPLSAGQMPANEEKTRPYFKDLQFFKNLSEWVSEC